MSFVSFHFVLFFVVVTTLFHLLPQRARWAWLIAASCWFYMALIPAYILILFFLIAIDYGAGLWIHATQDARARKRILIGSLIANLGMLGTFKYLNFLLGNVSTGLEAFGMGSLSWTFPLALPLGLSFHTFQSMAYTIEVYKGNRPAERHLGHYALYVLFYPQMVAGPIERPQGLLDQLKQPTRFSWVNFADGMKLMLWGLAKKVLIADRLAIYVNQVYANPGAFSGWEVALATVFFAFQIYCDFSGYTEIARGAALTMGYRLCVNFNHPYCSRSPAEFWHRWHISLSTWFRDYVYIPLGGSRVASWKIARNLLIAFLLSGLWHGAAWTFVIWGGLHGAYLVLQRLLEPSAVGRKLSALPGFGAFATTLTFALVCLAWVFFRAVDIPSALIVLGKIASPGSISELGAVFQDSTARMGLLLIAALETIHWLHRRKPVSQRLQAFPAPVRGLLWAALVLLVVLFGKFGHEEFLYFQF